MDKILRPGLFILLFVLVGVYAFVFGESGILERRQLEQGKQNLVEHLRSIQAQNSALREKLNSYRRGEYPPDLMNSKGYLKEGGRAVHVHGASVSENPADKKTAEDEGVTLFHFRIAWVVFSMFVIMLYLWYFLKQEDKQDI